MGAAEGHYFTHLMAGGAYPDVWGALGHDGDEGWEFRTASADSPALLYDLYDGAVERSRAGWRAVLSRGGLDQRVDMGRPEWHPSVRAVVCALLEEYGRHTGHADLLRESVDGRVGEDPPAQWRTRIFP